MRCLSTMMLFCFVLTVKAQTPFDDEDHPTADETVCFAANEQWVCAPVAARAIAHEKAMQLIKEAERNNVQITTVPEQTEWKVVEHSTGVTAERTQVMTQKDTQGTIQNQNFREWIAQHPSGWVLQLVGTTNRSNLDRFITEYDLSEVTFAVATTEMEGAPWYILLLGVYGDREAAVSVRDSLPFELQSAWPRQIASVRLLDN